MTETYFEMGGFIKNVYWFQEIYNETTHTTLASE